MKFEKVSEQVYSDFLKGETNSLESEHQRQQKIDFFNSEDLKLPKRSTGGSAGYDFVCPVNVYIRPGEFAIIGTGIKVQLEIDKVLELYPRSSIAETQELIFVNTVGIVDADYYNNEKNEGHILVLYRNLGKKPAFIKQGERFCQGIIKQYFTVDGDKPGQGPIRKGGLGSTGR